MYTEDGTETLILIRNHRTRNEMAAGEHRIAVDDETMAHYMNDPDIEVVAEETTFTRLNPVQYGLYPDHMEMPG
jgi:hypothetical protein